jgi:hypothetical protein
MADSTDQRSAAATGQTGDASANQDGKTDAGEAGGDARSPSEPARGLPGGKHGEPALTLGDRVDVGSGGGLWSATISGVLERGYFEVTYDDGLKESYVHRTRVSRLVKASATVDFAVGDSVTARKGGGPYTRARISQLNVDEAYFRVVYASGMEEEVRDDCIRPVEVKDDRDRPAGAGNREAAADNSSGSAFVVDDRVDVRWKNVARYTSGTITLVEGGERYEVRYDHGFIESSVCAGRISLLPKDAGPFHLKDRVRARKNGGSFTEGVITQVDPDGTYHVRFPCGIRRRRVRADCIIGPQ